MRSGGFRVPDRDDLQPALCQKRIGLSKESAGSTFEVQDHRTEILGKGCFEMKAWRVPDLNCRLSRFSLRGQGVLGLTHFRGFRSCRLSCEGWIVRFCRGLGFLLVRQGDEVSSLIV